MSCVAQKREGDLFVPKNDYDLEVVYEPQKKAFILTFESYADDKIFISVMKWVDENGGHFLFKDPNVNILVNGDRYPIKSLATGHCTSTERNGCVHILNKGDRLVGMLRVKDFKIPSEIYQNEEFDPVLKFPFSPRYC